MIEQLTVYVDRCAECARLWPLQLLRRDYYRPTEQKFCPLCRCDNPYQIADAVSTLCHEASPIRMDDRGV